MSYEKVSREDSPEKLAALAAAKAVHVETKPTPTWIKKLLERESYGEILSPGQAATLRRALGKS